MMVLRVGIALFSLYVEEGALCADIITRRDARGETPRFMVQLRCPSLPAGAHEAVVAWYGYRVCLYVDGVLTDEEWPLGTLPDTPREVYVTAPDTEYVFAHALPENDEDRAETFTGAMQFYAPPGHNAGAGDCMPFAHDGKYRLFFLFDRRGHRSKDGLGAHQWAQLSTSDLKTWTLHPMAVRITDQKEGSICTGSLIEKDGLVYAFYAVRMSDGSPARMTCAVSSDGVRFEKSDRSFALAEPYEPVSARDPKVFQDAEGIYHMFVTTSLKETASERYSGCLAHLTSADLLTFYQHDPILISGYNDQPECADYFEWNGLYYLIFSHHAIGRYRISESPFGPFRKPRHDIVGALEVQVPKTAAFGENRRLISGFLARRPRTYAGNIITHELIQRADGTLGVRFAEEILPDMPQKLSVPDDLTLSGGQGRAAAEIARASAFRMRAEFRPSDDAMMYGFELIDERGGETRAIFDAGACMLRMIRPNEDFDWGQVRDQLPNVDLSVPTRIDCILWRDMLDVSIGDGRILTMRLNRAGIYSLRLFAQCSELRVSELSVHSV